MKIVRRADVSLRVLASLSFHYERKRTKLTKTPRPARGHRHEGELDTSWGQRPSRHFEPSRRLYIRFHPLFISSTGPGGRRGRHAKPACCLLVDRLPALSLEIVACASPLTKFDTKMSAADDEQDVDPDVTAEDQIQERKPLWSPSGNWWKDFLFFSGPGWSVILCT